MANAVTTQILIDGDRNAVVKIVGLLDTSNLASTAAIDPANFLPVPTDFRVDQIDYSISSQLAVQLLWDATTDDVMVALTGEQKIKAGCDYGGLTNPHSTGWTGKINILTTGWASGTQTFTLIVQLVKMGV